MYTIRIEDEKGNVTVRNMAGYILAGDLAERNENGCKNVLEVTNLEASYILPMLAYTCASVVDGIKNDSGKIFAQCAARAFITTVKFSCKTMADVDVDADYVKDMLKDRGFDEIHKDLNDFLK